MRDDELALRPKTRLQASNLVLALGQTESSLTESAEKAICL
jgi:hypothetical protein